MQLARIRRRARIAERQLVIVGQHSIEVRVDPQLEGAEWPGAFVGQCDPSEGRIAGEAHQQDSTVLFAHVAAGSDLHAVYVAGDHQPAFDFGQSRRSTIGEGRQRGANRR
jgi:hypothetical protein